jgi:hypothetical protein
LADYLFDKEGTLLLADRQSSRNRQTTAVPAKKTGRRSR